MEHAVGSKQKGHTNADLHMLENLPWCMVTCIDTLRLLLGVRSVRGWFWHCPYEANHQLRLGFRFMICVGCCLDNQCTCAFSCDTTPISLSGLRWRPVSFSARVSRKQGNHQTLAMCQLTPAWQRGMTNRSAAPYLFVS